MTLGRKYLCAGHVAVLLGSISVSLTFGQDIFVADGQPLCGGMSGGTIRLAEFGGVAVVLVASTTSPPEGMALDPANDKMYYAQGGVIRRSTLTGSGAIDLIPGNQPQDIDLDLVAGKIYWHNFSEIKRADLSGANIQTLVPGLPGGGKIVLDVPGGKMYWTVSNSIPRRVDRANLDGTNVQTVVTVASPNTIDGIAIDSVNGKLYWTSFGLAKIQRTNLDGTGPLDVITGVSVGDIAVDTVHAKIFYRDSGGPQDKVRRANLDGSGAVDAVTGLSVILSITVNPLGNCENGDMNCDGAVNGDDISLFVQRVLAG